MRNTKGPSWVTNGSQRRPRECRLSGVKRKQSAIKQTLGLLVSAGVLDTPFGKFARLQILTIEDLFAGKKPTMPPEDPADIGVRYAWRPLGEVQADHG